VNASEFLKVQLAFLEEGRPFALVTIVGSAGSIPNAVGAKMLVGADGLRLAGTVGGGEVELTALQEGAAALQEGKNKLLSYRLTEKHAHGIGMMCGGTAQLFIEVSRPQARLILVGGGHVNLEIARLASRLGFRVAVIDDRLEWANESNYPQAELVLMTPKTGLATLAPGKNDYVIVATAESDTESLREMIRWPAAYVGLVASRRKTVQILRNLAGEGLELSGLTRRLRSPVGLDLGGKSPEAIALSVMAEVQAHRHGRSAKPLSYVENAVQAQQAKASATP
jgi:xanthine dehydrogenase accessory factor